MPKKSWLIRKDPDARKDWRQEEKQTTEDEMAGWHHQLDGHEVWANSRSWWRTGKPGVLQSMGLQRVRHDWATKQQQPVWRTVWGSSQHPVPRGPGWRRDSPCRCNPARGPGPGAARPGPPWTRGGGGCPPAAPCTSPGGRATGTQGTGGGSRPEPQPTASTTVLLQGTDSSGTQEWRRLSQREARAGYKALRVTASATWVMSLKKQILGRT